MVAFANIQITSITEENNTDIYVCGNQQRKENCILA